MFGYDNLHLDFNFSFIYLLIAAIIIFAYTVFIYKSTVPPISGFRKYILTCLRVLSITLIVLMLFEPVLSLSKKLIIEPVNLIFIDNSRSVKFNDGTKRDSVSLNFIRMINESRQINNKKYFTFGTGVRAILPDSFSQINFTEGTTNIEKIFFAAANADENISSITLITDGEYNSGNNPVYIAEQLGIPVFTIGIGDSSKRKDVEIIRVLNNDILYVNNPTEILATIKNSGFENQNVKIELTANGKLVEQKIINLANSGIQTETFTYTPSKEGEEKLLLNISPLEEEFTTANNRFVKYVKVLSDKIRILIVSSSPSADLAFIENSLKTEDNFVINSIIETGNEKSFGVNNTAQIDSANIIFMIGFPASHSNAALMNEIFTKINEKKVPYFFVTSPGTDINLFLSKTNQSSFTLKQLSGNSRMVQPEINSQSIQPFLISEESAQSDWGNLPPIDQPTGVYQSKPESKILAFTKFNNKVTNEPIILTRNFNGSRSVSVLAGNVWRWKLQTSKKNSLFFDSFVLNSAKWLNSPDDLRKIRINTLKKNYSQGEPVEFTAEIYDESLNPISDAEVNIDINSKNNKYELTLRNLSPGIYEGSLTINEAGDYNFTGQVFRNGSLAGKDAGSFNIGEIDLEFYNPRMNYEFLNLLAKTTGGEFFFPANFKKYEEMLNRLNSVASNEKIISSEINLRSVEWLMGLVILLFAIEWFLRKRFGLL